MATIQLPPDFKEFLRLLNSSEVEYLVIGGYAVNYYGYARATADLDIWISTAPKNAEKAASVVREFGFAQAEAAVFLEPGKVIRMGVPPVRLEILTSISGVEFASCYARRRKVELAGVSVNTHLRSAGARVARPASRANTPLDEFDAGGYRGWAPNRPPGSRCRSIWRTFSRRGIGLDASLAAGVSLAPAALPGIGVAR